MQVPVSYLFSKNKKIGSRIISSFSLFLAPEVPKVSHVAILVKNRWVHESTLESGVRILPYEKWLEINEEVANVPGEDRDYKEIKSFFKAIKGKKYDWGGALYLSFRIFCFRLLKTPVPEDNRWENPDKYFCSEVLGYILNKNFDMKAPNQILKKLLAKNVL